MKNKSKKLGRPFKDINYPNKKFTFTDLEAVNPNVTSLCLRLRLKNYDLKGRNSLIVKTDEKVPNPKGIGRNLEVYIKRSRLTVASKTVTKATKTKHKSITVKVADIKTVPQTTEQYEAQKAELLGTAPVAENAPVIVDTLGATPVETAPVVTEPVAA